MSNEQEVRNIEISIESARACVKTADCLRRLMTNPDFKDLILEGYFKDECIRLVSLKAAHEMRDEEHQTYLVKAMDGIGSLQQYFNVINYAADQAVRAIQDGEESLVELAQEELRAEQEGELS